MLNTHEKLVASIAEKAAPVLTDKLREMAAEAGWPDDAVQAVAVKLRGGDLQIWIDPKRREQVDKLEYGGVNTPPIPVLVRFKPRITEMINDMIWEQFSGHVSELVESL